MFDGMFDQLFDECFVGCTIPSPALNWEQEKETDSVAPLVGAVAGVEP